MSRDGKRWTEGKVDPLPATGIRRREFLKIAGVSLSAITVPEVISGCGPGGSGGGIDLEALSKRPSTFIVTVYRRDDMVALTFSFINLQLDGTGTKLERSRPSRIGSPGEPSLIVVSHEPQNMLERAFIEDAINSDPPPAQGPVSTWVSARSRVVYFVPDDVEVIPFTVEDLLAAARDYELSVGRNATPPNPPSSGRRIGIHGLALGPLIDRRFATVSHPFPVSTSDVSLAATSTDAVTKTVRATRGLRALARLGGQDLGFSPPPQVSQLIPIEVIPTIPRRAGALETSLELPFRLEVSPNRFGQWAHALDPVKSPESRVELWHSRLGVRGKDGTPFEGDSYLRTIRALWSRDSQMNATHAEYYDKPPQDDPFEGTTLRPRDRVRIVHESSNFTLRDIHHHLITPAPVTVNRLMLTALGGWADLRGDWGDDPPLSLALWEHRATMARDHFVKIVETGYLYPFGHRAVLITISERKFKKQHPHEAFLRKRTFLVVKQPTLDLSQGRTLAGVEKLLRKMPFSYITLKTLSTPPLDGSPDPTDPPLPAPFDVKALKVGGVPFGFKCEALDPEGRIITFTAPGVWVQGNLNDPVTTARFSSAQSLFAAYGGGRKCALDGQRMAFAPSNKPDDTTYEAQSLTFTAGSIDATDADDSGYQARFVPEIDETELAVQAVRQLAGSAQAPAFSYHKKFVDHGFDAGNEGEILFGLASGASPIGVSFSSASDKSGGFLTPNMKLSGLSRKIGPAAGDLDALAGNSFDPSKFFAGLDAKIFGVIDLFSIIDDLVPGGIESKAPKFITQALDVVEGFIQDATAMASDLSAALGAGAAVVTDLQKAVADIAPDPSKLAALAGDLTQLDTDLASLATSLASASMNGGLKQDILRRAAQLKSVIAVIMPAPPAIGPIDLFLQAAEMAKDLRVKLDWRPPLKAFSLTGDPIGDPLFEPHDPANALILSAEVRGKAVEGKPAGVDLVASLENFSVYLIGKKDAFLTIPFDHIRFSILAGQKPDVDVSFGDMAFGGVLAFVDTLRKLIPSDGFSDPPSLTVDDGGISASFSVALPSVAIGCMTLQNISLGAGFKIPFIGDPLSVSFNFCTRENPFLLTVMMIGGGGFFGITLDPKGVKILEAQFEAGAELALDFGVASGSVSVMIGIYFKMEGDDCTLMAFFKIHGEVEVLGGIISASLTLELDLTYESATGKLTGTASMEIEVQVLFFSGTVTASYSTKLAGSNGDPTFADVMKPSLPEAPPAEAYFPWDEYVGAFAA